MSKSFAMFAASALTATAFAEGVTTNNYYQASAQGTGSNTAWTYANWKLNGEGDAVAPSAGTEGESFNNYITALGQGTGYLLRTPASGEFPGDKLTIGAADKAGSMLMKNGVVTLKESDYITFKNLELVQGVLSLGGTYGVHGLKVENDILVSANADKKFYLSGAKGRSLVVNGLFASADSDALLYVMRNNIQTTTTEQNGSMLVRLDKASPNYKGKWIVDNKADNNNYIDSTTDTSLEINVADDSVLGDFPETLMEDAVTLKNGGQLSFNTGFGSSDAPFNPTNRALYVDSTGGQLRNSGSQNHLYFAMMLAGTGTLTSHNK